MDREKVIKELTCCIYSEEECECPEECPYVDDDMSECQAKVMRDALALLKEQEAVQPNDARKSSSCVYSSQLIGYCKKCGAKINSIDNRSACGKCGQAVKWDG